MKIRQIGSSVGDSEVRQHMTTFLINETLAIDAGCLGLLSPIECQRRVKHVLLSHSHLDHIATLPSFLDTVFQPGGECPTVYASGAVWNTLKTDVLNERLWPDLFRLASNESRFLHEQVLKSEVSIEIDGIVITPVEVDHVVPTLGFLIEDADSAVLISSDTGPTQKLWDFVNRPGFRKKLKAVFLECSFPDSYDWLATESGHLNPQLFAKELKKITAGGPFRTIATHLKASLYQKTASELESLGIPDFEIGSGNATWLF